MTDPQLNPDVRDESSLNRLYRRNKTIADRVLFIIITTILASVFHVKLDDIESKTDAVKTTTELNKDIVTKAADTQQKVVAVEVRGNEQDVAALKATTQQGAK